MTDFYDDNDWWMIPLIVIVLFAVVVGGIVLGVNQLSYKYTKQTCPKYATARNIQTKFVRYNMWQYDCLQKTPNNTWIPVDDNVETNR